MKSEKQIESYLKKKVIEAGGLCYKWTSPGTAGVPDRIIIMPKGKIYFAELKAEGKRNNLSTLQRAFLAKLIIFDCKIEILASYEDVDKFIKKIEKSGGDANEVHTT